MNTANEPRERFRKGFVLVMTLAYASMFFLMISDFVVALLLAAVFSAIAYPFYSWLRRLWGGRTTLASLATLLVSLVVIVAPVIFLLGLVADQAIEVSQSLSPWIDQQLHKAGQADRHIPGWVPFAEQLEPYHERISAKIAEVGSKTGGYLAASLGKVTQGTITFFLHLFIMLYAMFFFLISGSTLLDTILGYVPLSQDDKQKMIQVGLSVSRATVKGTLTIALIQGTLGGIGFAVAGIEAPVFWGAVMVVLSMLPGIGATLVWAPVVAYLLIAGQTLAGLGLLAWCAGVVGSIDNFLRPALVGRDTEMPDLLILLSTLGGIGLFGFSGLVLGPILAALFMTVLAIYSRVFGDWLNPEQTEI